LYSTAILFPDKIAVTPSDDQVSCNTINASEINPE
jgi:hypothetical protein